MPIAQRLLAVTWALGLLCSATARAQTTRPEPAGAAVAPFAPDKLRLAAVGGEAAFRHGGSITCVVPLPDGRRVLTGARDTTARLWDLATGKELVRYALPGEGEDLWHVALSADATEVISSGEKGINRWRLDTGKWLGSFPRDETVFRLAVAPEGKRTAEVCGGKLCLLRGYPDGKEIRRLTGHSQSVYAVVFSADGKTVITGSADDTIRYWDAATGKETRQIKSGTGTIYTLVMAPNKQRILVCSEKKKVFVMQASDGKELVQSDLPKAAYCADWSPDGNRIVASCYDDHVYVLDAATGKTLWKSPLPADTNYGVAFGAGGREVLCGSDHLLCRYDAATGKRLYPAADVFPLANAVSALAVVGPGGAICRIGGATGVQVHTAAAPGAVLLAKEKVEDLAACGESDLVLAGTRSAGAVLVSVRTGQTVRKLAHSGKVERVAVTPDGQFAVTAGGSSGYQMNVWRVDNGAKVHTITAESQPWGKGLAVSPDGAQLAAVSDTTVSLWSVQTGNMLQSIAVEGKGVRCFAFVGRGYLVGRKEDLSLYRAPVPTANPLAGDEVRRLVAQLGANSYRTREKATARLLEAGSSILPLLAGVQSANLEVTARLQHIREGLLGGKSKYDRKHALALSLPDAACLAVHPDGKHWAAIEGEYARAKIVLGEIRDEKLTVLRKIEDPNMPLLPRFDRAGTLYVGNRNGTVSRYVCP